MSDRSRKYDAVLCDLDGVLRHWPAMDEVERDHGFAAGAVLGAAFAPHRLQPAITGAVTDDQWRAAVVADLTASCGSADRAGAAVAAWSAMQPRVDQEVVDLLTRARRTTTLALLSNATTRLEQDLDRQGLAALADVVVNTARAGVAKPDPRIYRIAAERVGVAVERCLFVDDSLDNVLAAREVGMGAVHFRGVEDLRGALSAVFESRAARG
ncbi:putative hydrolase of the HAD superfamily [Kitasatospora sp. MAA4]|uniref:HAD family hydrolase n=1 Tax=Kitasatospora sp. MAA4 TaxID=3035093 RepID=UPI0024751E4A|nr:HAD-IA family hydrolase [Kitasatospora sp. MAA4]MDH6135594.1 putative hydrolase of the HAD superfamily [Kitasatospora sp. MAA4]